MNHLRRDLKSAAKRILGIYENSNNVDKISMFYENRPYYVEFIDTAKDFIKNQWEKYDEFEYTLWGITQTSKATYNYITNNYPNSKLAAILHKNKKNSLFGFETQGIEWIQENPKPFVFVCTGVAIKESYELFEKIKKILFFNVVKMEININWK